MYSYGLNYFHTYTLAKLVVVLSNVINR